jgi:hypothetical protein
MPLSLVDVGVVRRHVLKYSKNVRMYGFRALFGLAFTVLGRNRLGTRHAPIHVGAGTRKAFHHKSIQSFHGKPAVFNEPIDAPIQVASTREYSLEGIQDSLPSGDLWIVASAVL